MPETDKTPAKIKKKLTARQKWWISASAMLILLAVLFSVLSATVFRGPVVLSYRSLTVRKGVFNYLYSYYRYRIPATDYYKKAGVTDTEAFWASPYDETKTNGEHYGEVALRMICQTVAAARLFDANTSLSATERNELKQQQYEVLQTDYKGGGTEKSFNEKAAVFGFDFDDFREGSILLYKASKLQTALYGTGGLLTDEDELNGYFAENYVRVQTIFVRTKDKFVIDGDGNYVSDGDGALRTEPLTEQEAADKEAHIEAVKAALSGGCDEAEFAALQASYNEDGSARQAGVYFGADALFTQAFAESFPAKTEGERDLVSVALSLAVGQSAEVQSEYGTHFLFRCENEPQAYKISDCEEFFSDFYADAAQSLFASLISSESEKVNRRDEAYLSSLDFASAVPNKLLWL